LIFSSFSLAATLDRGRPSPILRCCASSKFEQGCLQLDARVKILGRADANAFDAR